MATNINKRFLILIGGPGVFKSCDKAHDQTWTNYIVPLQLAAQRGLYKKADNEQIYWLVYEPPYRNRWLDDATITKKEKKQDDGAHLHSIRKAAADRVKKAGAASYLHRIKQIAAQHKIIYEGISKPKDFWAFIKSCPKGSITRVWYCGHASQEGLMLALIHDTGCMPGAYDSDMIFWDSLKTHKDILDRFDAATTKASRFYGCYTDFFAQEWNKVFKVPAQGAARKVDFSCINQSSGIKDILTRIEQTPTKIGSPDWRSFK